MVASYLSVCYKKFDVEIFAGIGSRSNRLVDLDGLPCPKRIPLSLYLIILRTILISCISNIVRPMEPHSFMFIYFQHRHLNSRCKSQSNFVTIEQ